MARSSVKWAGLVIGVSLLAMVGTAKAIVLDFEGISGAIPNSYGGFQWNNMNVVDASTPSYSLTGYRVGTVSGTNVAYNAYGSMAVVSNGVFDFNGAYLTGAWNDLLNITINGYLNNVLMYSSTVIASAYSATYFAVDFMNIDRLSFSSFGGTDVYNGGQGTQFAMDNFTVNETANVPEPGTMLLLSSGLLGLAVLRRKKLFNR